MTAESQTASPAYAAELQLIPLAELHESALNPRKYFPAGPLQELADSIAKSGIRTPLIARSRLQGGGYEIAAGHRRLRAAKIAGVAHAPVMVREMSDAEFLEVLTFENGQREDVHPLEEAAGYQTYMRETLAGVADVAGKVGKSGSYVYGRLKLLELTEEGQRAFWDGKISAAHAQLIARCDAADQAKALKACEPPQWAPEIAVSVRGLQLWIKKNLQQDLKNAPFPLESIDLVPDAGSCVACPFRSDNTPDFNPSIDLRNICTRVSCYVEKEAAHGQWVKLSDVPPEAPAEPPPAPKPAAASKPKVSKGEKDREAERKRIEQAEQEKERTRLTREREEREAKLEKEKALRHTILRAILAKVKWPPLAEEIAALLGEIVPELENELDEEVKAQGIAPGDRFMELHKLPSDRIARLVVIVRVSKDFDDWSFGHGADILNAAAKRYGVDHAKLRAEAEGGTRKEVIQQRPVAGAAAKKAAPAKKAAALAKKAAPKKKAGKK